jgi:hypothetical protein
LTNFDKTWTHYENVYVVELMVIENDARRFIVEALQTEAGLQKLETEYKSKPLKTLLANTQYLELRKASVEHISALNAVANTSGKGRDDFSVDILTKAEKIVMKASNNTKRLPRAVLDLATQVCQTYEQTRQLLKKYSKNMEVLDP